MQDAGSSLRHSTVSDATPHRVSEGGASLEDGKEATPKNALRTQWGLGHKRPASDRQQAATSLEGVIAHWGGTGKGVRDSGDRPHCGWGCETETSKVS